MNVWGQVLSVVAKLVNSQCFETWFRPIVCTAADDHQLTLTVPTEDFKNCIVENYIRVLEQAARTALERTLKIEIVVEPDQEDEQVSAAPEPALLLNPRYTFPSFVVGSSNQFAHAAALAVAEQPSKAYNPLYIYGGVGLGKTHLMHAIGHRVLSRNGSLRLNYMSAEQFINELVNHLRFDRMMQFRELYRNIDVLLIDDIQFLAGKERTQEEFFHTFNALYDAQKQIVVSSDCPPRAIPTLEERLHSRFEWGLIADIQPPDLETKLAILRKKAEFILPSMSDEVAMLVAGGIRSNIRELEGALIRLNARASLDGVPISEISPDYAREVLRNILSVEAPDITPEKIMRVVAEQFGLKPGLLKSKSNARRISEPRQIAMFVCKKMTRLSLPQIGRDFGGKHHTTVLHSIRKVETMIKADGETSRIISKIMRSLG